MILVLLMKRTSSPLRSLVMFGKTVPGPFFNATQSVMTIKFFPGDDSAMSSFSGADSCMGISTEGGSTMPGCGTGAGAGACCGSDRVGIERAGGVGIPERDATWGASG